MKFGIFLLCSLWFFLITPLSVSAHLPGQEPFFKINSLYSPLYPIFSTSRENFVLPQDIAPELYEINSSIQFEIDTDKLPMINADILKKMKFIWDFGDTTKGEGTLLEHTYTKMGSYIVTIYADDGVSSPVLFQSTLVHILPFEEYKLPRAVIMVNKKMSDDPLVDPLSFSLKNTLLFDATKSFPGETSIESYYWDFGDMAEGKKAKERHAYLQDLRIVFPVLRVRDKNGFINDAFVQINNTLYEKKVKGNDTKSSYTSVYYGGGVIVGLLLFVIGITFVKAKKK